MIKIFTLFFLISTLLQAQNLDSLYNLLVKSKEVKSKGYGAISIENSHKDKCGFGLRATIIEHLDEFSLEKQQTINNILERPSLNNSIISPSGFFRIHYDISGINAPAYSIDELAIALDSAYSFEIDYLGYPAPPKDGNLGGDDKYDVYVENLGVGNYGATTPEVTLGEGKYLSYIQIDNSFGKNEGFNSVGINAARVTAAHEFHHAIQLGNYIFRSEDTYYYEITSTSMEEFVYDNVNDYYAYMNSYFKYTSNRFEDNSGYNLAIWNIYLQERFADQDPLMGHKIIKKSWELMRDKSQRAIVAIASALNDFGYSFEKELNTFGVWLYFTDTRSNTNKYFEESKNYPLVKNTIDLTLNEKQSVMVSSKPTSINYVSFKDFSQGFVDTIVAVISNSDVINSSQGNSIEIDYSISNSSFEGSTSINDSYFKSITGTSKEFIYDSYIINGDIANSGMVRSDVSFVFPQPFNYNLNSIINFPTYPDLSKMARLNIYSSDMNLVYSNKQKIFSNDKIVVKWNGLDNNGKELSSGVYVYVTKADGKIKKGKFVILK